MASMLRCTVPKKQQLQHLCGEAVVAGVMLGADLVVGVGVAL